MAGEIHYFDATSGRIVCVEVEKKELATSIIVQKLQDNMGIPKISNDTDLLHPPAEIEKQKHKLMRLPLANHGYMPQLLASAMPANWWPHKTY
ncbi:hypothetical protein KY290_031281 [Solanum tuberosum]|uniref:Uncharacterized protein n=1 Tax=Solanum tuberosum TaxID=4113 RepID=A0ABQ7U9X5_SOLTU|nr:hypothetical protein KY290_031281 [Solanum tuberosum]